MTINAVKEKRGWHRLTSEDLASVLEARERMGATASHKDIAEAVGMTPHRVKYILTDLPRLRRAQAGDDKATGSLRERILRCLSMTGQMDSVDELRRVLGMDDDEHNTIHVLHSLRKAGQITFDDRGNGKSRQPIHIRLRKKGERSPALQTEMDSVVEGAAVQAMADVMPEPEVTAEPAREETANVTSVVPLPEPGYDQYPVLERLRARQREAVEAEAIAAKYVAAAELLGEVDPSMADRLMDEAAAVSISLTAEHLEYLRYAEEHSQHNDEFDR